MWTLLWLKSGRQCLLCFSLLGLDYVFVAYKTISPTPPASSSFTIPDVFSLFYSSLYFFLLLFIYFFNFPNFYFTQHSFFLLFQFLHRFARQRAMLIIPYLALHGQTNSIDKHCFESFQLFFCGLCVGRSAKILGILE